jgi:DNA topoisomerase IB
MRLRRSDVSRPALTRRSRGTGFEYLDGAGRLIHDAEVLGRIEALAIPPAWTDVWICAWRNGHIQAVGTDAAGRRQYLYHPEWRARRDQEKSDHMLEFARALPRIRQATSEALAGRGLRRDRVLACAVRLLDVGFFRVGSETYAEENSTYGLATMRKEHVKLGRECCEVTFEYVAKSHKERVQSIVDPAVHQVMRALKRRRGGGPELLAYHDGGWRDVRSEDINEYIKELSGGDYTAKDFRTWHATVLAAVGLAVSTEAARTTTASRRAVGRAVKEVAHYLGNTPAVARRSYIDPRVIDRYQSGVTIAGALEHLVRGSMGDEGGVRQAIETAVIDLIEDRPSPALARVGSERPREPGRERSPDVVATTRPVEGLV